MRFDLALGLARGRRGDPQLHAGQGAAFGSEPAVTRAVERQHRRCFGQPVAREHGPAEPLEIERELGRQLRAAAADQGECGAETRVHGAKEPPTDVQARHAAHGDARGEQHAEHRARGAASCLDSRSHTVPERAAEAWYCEQRRGVGGGRRAADLRPRDAGGKDHGGACCERYEQAHGKRIRVVQG